MLRIGTLVLIAALVLLFLPLSCGSDVVERRHRSPTAEEDTAWRGCWAGTTLAEDRSITLARATKSEQVMALIIAPEGGLAISAAAASARPHVPLSARGGSSLIMSFDEGCAG